MYAEIKDTIILVYFRGVFCLWDDFNKSAIEEDGSFIFINTNRLGDYADFL